MARSFRSEESFVAERTTRDMLINFLREHGYTSVVDKRKSYGRTQSQVLEAKDEKGRKVALWVRLCWRQSGKRKEKRHYSAAQLLARVEDGDWVGTIERKLRHARQDGVTHLLLVQRFKNTILYAAAIRLDAVVPIWKKQRDISKKLIQQGALGRRTKNHAMNGASPTLWLQDDKAPAVAAALWRYRGVRDLARLPKVHADAALFSDADSIDDLPGIDYSALGSDGADKVQRITSGVKRDDRVRQAVLLRSNGVCERTACGATRPYPGFLDVHHILGAEKSDRVWNCVAICPNCHREAHAAPNRDELNAKLLIFAGRFGPASATPIGGVAAPAEIPATSTSDRL